MEDKLRKFLLRKLERPYSPTDFVLRGEYFFATRKVTKGQHWLVEVKGRLFICEAEAFGIFCREVELGDL